MTDRSVSPIETLERRTLLAHVGLDLNFGAAGYTPVDGSLLVAPLTGGKVLAVGETKAVRLNADGTVDSTFVDRGAASDVPRSPSTAVVAGQQLFIAGITRTPLGHIGSIFVRKLNLKTGATNAGFGTGGAVVFDPVLAVAGARADSIGPASMVPTSDGGVIVAVRQHLRAGNPGSETFPQAIVLHKLDATGKLDPAFGNKGVVTATLTTNGDYVGPVRLAGYPDGRFVLIGGTEGDPTVQRFNANGSLDTTFADQGVLALDTVGLNFLNLSFGAPVVQPDGKLLMPAASADISLHFSTAFIVRLNADGTVDESFGDNGRANLGREEGSFNPSDIALDPAGRIVGIAREAELYRLEPDGDFDATFDDDGLTTAPQAPGAEGRFARGRVAIDAAGNVLLGRAAHVSRFVDNQQRVDLGSDRIVHVDGRGDAADVITAAVSGDTLTVTINGQNSTFAVGDVSGFLVTDAGGDNHIDLAAAAFSAIVNVGDGHDSISTSDAGDRIHGAGGDDTVAAGGGRDLILGGNGNDSIFAGGGDDRAFGEYGNDSIAGGDGRDRLYGGHTFVLTDDEYTSLFDGDDSLSGNAGNDRLNGQSGNDRVAGNGGRDRLFGGSGSDRIYGGASGDWLYGEGGDQLFGEGGADRLYSDSPGSHEDTLRGNAGDDFFFTRDGHVDHLFGDGGRDTADADDDDLLASIESVA